VERSGERTPVYPFEGEPGVAFVGAGGGPFTVGDDGALYVLHARQRVHATLLRIAQDGRLRVLAGGDWGLADGRGAGARFRDLHGSAFVLGPDGSLYLTDGGTAIRRVSPEGAVATLAGGEEPGFADGASDEARFRGAAGLALDPSGAIFVADRENHRIRRLDAEEDTVTTFAGTGESGSTDGPVLEALFSHPSGICRSPSGALFVLEHPDGRDEPRVRRISPDGKTVTTVSGSAAR
jgi:hypothetical protein